MLTSFAMGQINFTFMVDMNNETVSANGVHVAGNFQAASGEAGDWDPATSELLDDDMDGIYTLTVSIPAGGYEYKYLNGNTWDDEESIPEVSQVGFGNGNRYFQLTAASDSTTGPLMFSGSAPDGMYAVKFQVDIPDGADSVAHVAGDAFDPNWTPNAIAMYNVSNNISAVTYAVADGTYSYKFLTSDTWGTDETIIPDSCSEGGNRQVTMDAADLILEPVCFNACGPCAGASDITFSVDMSQSCIDLGSDVVNLMGTATDWGDGAPMMDDDADGVWELTLSLQPGDYEYKFRVGSGTWEGISNRMVTVVEDTPEVLETDCWNSTEPCPSGAFDPADVTFTVDVSDSTIEAGEFVWLFGDFTVPTWQDGAIQMTDNGDGTWSTTVADFCPQEGRYKFAIGVSSSDPSWTEENAEFEAEGGCGESQDGFPDNRVIIRSTNDPSEVCFIFNTCDECAVGVAEYENLQKVEIYPNPTNGVFNIVFKQYDEYSVRILDISGKVIYSNVINADRLNIDDNTMVSGIYFVQIADVYNNTVTKKLVVK